MSLNQTDVITPELRGRIIQNVRELEPSSTKIDIYLVWHNQILVQYTSDNGIHNLYFDRNGNRIS